jgi:hypothetical protein
MSEFLVKWTVESRMFWAVVFFMLCDILYFLFTTACCNRQFHNYVIKWTLFIKIGLILFDL